MIRPIVADSRGPRGARVDYGGATGRAGVPSLGIGLRPRPESPPREDEGSAGGSARTDGGTVSQIRTVRSPDAEASLEPSGLKATACT
jgi:hypothetical protein